MNDWNESGKLKDANRRRQAGCDASRPFLSD
jgi:hypothetical protein